ncbi:asparagine synthase [Halobacteriales archaeon QS_4_62_28]|nr:MAG: asparagine synthase [Halobacteriales archaeon QS_4_62_28]
MIHGTAKRVVRRAIRTGDPLPGTRGFAGRLDDAGEVTDGPALVRDVLGRVPLFVERDAADPTADGAWAFDRSSLTDPVSLPAGHCQTVAGDEHYWALPDVAPTGDDTDAVAAARGAIEAATADVSSDDTAVAFSGGVDSALLAARLDAPLYVTGFEGSHDIEAARSAAAALDRTVTVVEFTHADLERAVPEISRATGRTNAMDVQIALPLFLTAERAAADGFDRLLVGQGADELFGGYAKVASAPDDHRIEADTVRAAQREVIATLPDQLERDVLTLQAAGVEPVAPLLDDRVIRAALGLTGDQLVRGEDHRKWALRQAASEWLPDDIAARDKKAVQYGTYAARELDRLARQNGFKRRMDDHVTKYVESLLSSRTG